MDCSNSDPSVHGILQARILEWVVILFSRGFSQPRDWTHISRICRILYYWVIREAPYNPCVGELFSRVRFFATPWSIAFQAPPSVEFSRQEYWSGLSFSSPGDLPDSGIELGSPALWADSLPSEPPRKYDPLGFHSWILQITGQKIVYFEICCCNGKF